MENFKKKYRDLESRVVGRLWCIVEKSKYISPFVGEKAIKLHYSDYEELAIINDKLTFIDSDGQQYSLFVVTLEDLIEIIYDSKKK